MWQIKTNGKKIQIVLFLFVSLSINLLLFFFFNLWKFWLNSCYHQPHVHVTQTLSNFPWKFKSCKAQVRFGMKCTIIWHPVPKILINGNIWANNVPIRQKSPSLVTKFFFLKHVPLWPHLGTERVEVKEHLSQRHFAQEFSLIDDRLAANWKSKITIAISIHC